MWGVAQEDAYEDHDEAGDDDEAEHTADDPVEEAVRGGDVVIKEEDGGFD